MGQAESAYRQMLDFHKVFLGFACFWLFLLLNLHRPEAGVSPVLLAAMAMAGSTDILIAAVLRSRHLFAALEVFRVAPEDAAGGWSRLNEKASEGAPR